MEEQKSANAEQESSLITKANEAAKRLEDANKKAEEILSRQILSGKSEAGSVPAPKPSKEEAVRERVNKMLKNTGLKI